MSQAPPPEKPESVALPLPKKPECPPFAVLPSCVLRLPAIDMQVFAALAAHAAGTDRTCFPRVAVIAALTGLSDRRVRRAIKRLEDAGYITRTYRHRPDGSQSATTYDLSAAYQACGIGIGGGEAEAEGDHDDEPGPHDQADGRASTAQAQAEGSKPWKPSRAAKAPGTRQMREAEKAQVLEMVPPGVEPETWQAFVENRDFLRKPMSSKAALGIHRELAKLAATGQNPEVVVNQSLVNGWMGVFAVKGGALALTGRQAAVAAHNADVKARFMERMAESEQSTIDGECERIL